MSEPPNQTEPNGQTPPETPPSQPRDNKGKFQPKPSAPPPPTPPVEPPPSTSPPEKDELLDEIEKDLTNALKDQFNPKDLEGLDQRMRIKMLRILAKIDNGKRNPTIDPTNPPPPTETHIPTLAELNRSDKYRADMLPQHSFLGVSQKLRSGK